MRKITYIFFCVSVFAAQFYAQQPTEEWVRRFSWGSNNYSSGLSVKSDSSGNIYVLVSQGTDSTHRDYGILKYNSSGNLIWNTYYNSPGNLDDNPIAFDVSKAGDVYITGSSGINFVYNSLTVKFNSNGVLQWDRLYSGLYEGNDIAIDKSGDILIIGNSSKLIKYDPFGDTLWTREIIINNYSNILTKLVVDDSANVYATGYSTINTQTTNYLTVKYNRNGMLIWYSMYGVTGYGALANSIAIDSNRNVYVVGVLNVPQPGFWDNVLIKINPDGVLQWAKNYTGINNNHSCSATPVGLSVTSDGNNIYYATKCNNGQGGGANDMITLKYNSVGDSVWVRRYNGGVFASANVPVTLKLDQYNNAYITGYADYTATGTDYVTIKYLPNGIQQWVTTYNGYNNFVDNANELSVDSSNVYVTGTSRNISNNSTDAVTIKYNQVIGIISNNNELPNKYELHQNYPNPFNSTTIINYEIPKKSYVELKIYNSIGQLVRTLVSKEHDESYYSIMYDAVELSTGIYFYTLISDNMIIDTKKLIIVK